MQAPMPSIVLLDFVNACTAGNVTCINAQQRGYHHCTIGTPGIIGELLREEECVGSVSL